MLRRSSWPSGVHFTPTPPPAPAPAPPAPGPAPAPPAPAPSPAPPPPPPAPPTPAPAPPTSVTFDEAQQKRVNEIMAAEKEQGRRSAEASIAEQLGCTIEEAKTILEAHRAADEATKTEAEKLRDQAAKDQEKAKADTALAQRMARDAALTVLLSANGVTVELDDKGEMTGRAARIVKLLDVPNDANAEVMKAAIEKLKTDEPALFAAQAPPAPGPGGIPTPPVPGAPPPPGLPPGSPPATPPAQDGLSRGAARAAEINKRDAEPFDPLKL